MINAKELGLKLYTILELSRKLNVSTGVIYKYIKQDRLISVKIGRKLFIPEHSIVSFLNCTPTQQKDIPDPNPDTTSSKARGLFKRKRS